MTWLDLVPPFNTILVAASAALMILSRQLIRQTPRNVRGHRQGMVAATVVFALFLSLYATRLVIEGPTPFRDQNPEAPFWAAPFYFTFLGVHMTLAVVTVGLLVPTLTWGLKGQFAKHRRIAPWTFWLWLVSDVMGISVYFLLFQVWS